MSVSKDNQRATWKVYIRYKDWMGQPQVKTKRGFATKKEALAWEREFLQMQSKDINMSMNTFVNIYMRDMEPRLKRSTFLNKQHLIQRKILPFFGQMSLSEIKPADVVQWQNELLTARNEDGNPYSPTYLRTIQNQLSAIINHAVRYYALSANPSKQAGKIGKATAVGEMLFWTHQEYLCFIKAMKTKPQSYYAFELLYGSGIRCGELLALTPSDFDFEKNMLRINKTYQRLDGVDMITSPKTETSNRMIVLPDYLSKVMQDYISSLYGIGPNDRIFAITKSYLHREMERGCKETGVKRIRIHDLRHSHVAHLIELGFSPMEIADRLGHKGISVTFMYAHLYPSKQYELADKLSIDRTKMIAKENEEENV